MLIVGIGSGYVAALVMELAKFVAGVERFRRLADRAAKTLVLAGTDPIQIKHDDGMRGWQELAPFDRILLTGAVSSVPDALLGQLAKGGFCVAPVIGDGQSELISVNADGTCLQRRDIAFHAPLQTGVSKAL